MPRLPTIRVIGSQDISLTTMFWVGGASSVAMGRALLCGLWDSSDGAKLFPAGLIARFELRPRSPPRGLPVTNVFHRLIAEETEERAVGEARHERGGRAFEVRVHERHVFVGKARHGAADADAADVRTAADPALPAADRNFAVDH